MGIHMNQTTFNLTVFFLDDSDFWGISCLKSTRFPLFFFPLRVGESNSHQPPSDLDTGKIHPQKSWKVLWKHNFPLWMPPQNAKSLHEIMRWYDALFLRSPLGFHCLFATLPILSLQVLCLAMMVLPVLHLGFGMNRSCQRANYNDLSPPVGHPVRMVI